MIAGLDANTLGVLAVGVGIILGGLFNGWQTMQAKREAKQAKQYAYPVSNGWGHKLADDMSYVRRQVDRSHARLDEMARRQNTHDERIEAAARHARSAAEASHAVSVGLTAHLNDHARDDAERRAS